MEPRADLANAQMELCRHGGDLTIEEITQRAAADLDLMDLLHYNAYADEMVGAANLVRRVIRNEIAARLGDRGAARYGDLIYRNGSETKWRVIDPEGLAAWLGGDWAKVVRVSGDNLRRTALRGLADARGISPETVIDTFMEVSYTDRDLQVMPLEKAPKFLQDLAEGEVRDR